MTRVLDLGLRASRRVDLKVPLVLILLLAAVIAAWGAPKARHTTKPASPKSAAEIALEKARDQVLSARPLAMFYFVDDSSGAASLHAHADAITLVAPQCYTLDHAGTVQGQLPSGVLEITRRNGLPLMPLVTNMTFDRAAAHALLHNSQAQARAITSLAWIAGRNQYVGWQLDFENIDPVDKLAYSRFVTRLATRLHHDHRLLSLAVVPRFSDDFPDNPATVFHSGEWGAGFDFRELGRVADFLVLMAYDEHTSLTPPGPVAGFDWVDAAVGYASTRVPASKLLLGIPFYGREWVETPHGTTVHSITFKDLKRYSDRPETVRNWDDLFRTAWFQMVDGDTQRTAWFDDARSLREKLKLVQTYHLRGYAAWRLGLEDPEFWEKETPDP